MGIKIAVTEPEYRKAEEVFSRAPEFGCEPVPASPAEVDLAGFVREHNIRFAIVGIIPYRGPLYEALGAGGVLARFGVGHDSIDKGIGTAAGVLCTNTPGVLDDSVAEHTINLMLALARRTAPLAHAVRSGQWPTYIGTELKGRRLAVIGCGPIGCRVARIAARGFGMQVFGLKKTAARQRELQDNFGFANVSTSLEECIDRVDFASLHIPSLPETHHFLGRHRLALLPAHCGIINTARGALIDESALFDALAANKLSGAALDVFEREPYQPITPGKDLRTVPNVLMTPHVGSSTRAACDRIAERSLRNVRLAMAGNYAEMDLLNPAVLEKTSSL